MNSTDKLVVTFMSLSMLLEIITIAEHSKIYFWLKILSLISFTGLAYAIKKIGDEENK